MHMRRNIQHPIVVKIQPGHRIVGLWMRWLLLQPYHLLFRIKLHDSILLRALHPVAKNRGTLLLSGGTLEPLRELIAVEEVVAQNEGHRLVPHKLPAKDERLRQSLWLGLGGIGKAHPPLAAIAQQAAKLG